MSKEEQKMIFEILKTKKDFRKKNYAKSQRKSKEKDQLPLIIHHKKLNMSTEQKRYLNLPIFSQANKAFQKTKVIREKKANVKKMDFINLFTYKKSNWNHESYQPKESPPKQRRKESLPDFRKLMLQNRKKEQTSEEIRNELLAKGDFDIKDIEKEVNERLKRQREIRKLFKEKRPKIKKPQLSKEEMMNRIRNSVKDVENICKSLNKTEIHYNINNRSVIHSVNNV